MLVVLILTVMLPLSSPACTGRDPYFTATPQIKQVADGIENNNFTLCKMMNDQVDVEGVRVSWDGMLSNAHCADWMRVKHWKSDGSDTDYDLSEKLDKTSRSFIVTDLIPYRSYTFEVRTGLKHQYKKP